MKRPLPWILAFAALLLLVGWAARRGMEKVVVDEWVGYSGEARSNPWFAAQKLAEGLGHPVRVRYGIPQADTLPEPGELILLPRRHRALGPAQAQELLGWVRRGGVLVTTGLGDSPEEVRGADALLSELGLREVGQRAFPAWMDAWIQGQGGAAEARLRLGGGDLALRLDSGLRLEAGDPPPGVRSWLWADAAGTVRAAGLGLGAGQVLVFSDLDFLSNPRLDQGDDAAALAWILARRPGARVWVLPWDEVPGLWGWLRQHAAPALWALALLAAAFLMRARLRFGPYLPEPQEARRSLLEHVAAVGRFLWAHGEGEGLLQATRQAFHRRLARVHPGWTALPPDELATRLAAFSGLPEASVFEALRYDRAPDGAALARSIRTLEILRKSL